MSIWSALFGRKIRPLPYESSSPEGLAARWVQWAASAPVATNPLVDEDGRHSETNQPADIYFLAGCFGGTVERQCQVRSTSSLFFPAFNMWTFGAEGPPQPVTNAHGYITLDGDQVEPKVIATPKPFDVQGVKGNPVTQSTEIYPAVVWGLWKKLDPLPHGRHELSFGGGDGHDFSLDVHYVLDVVS